jgi:type IV secretion system protein VirB11
MPAAAAESMLATCAAMLNTTVHCDSPILEGEFPLDGSRLQGLVPPIVRAPAFAIRKRTQRVLTLEDFRASGVIGAGGQGIDALRDAVRQRHNILIVGGTGSGKTTLANAVLDEVAHAAPQDRLVAIEDTMELQVNVPNHVLLRANGQVDMQRLLRATLRLRPDRIVVGEVRGGEALTLLKSWNTGHPGGLATIHANSAQAGLLRLCQLIREAPEAANLSEHAVAAMVAEAVHIVMFIQRIAPAPGRRVSEIVRVRGFEQGRFEVESVVQQPCVQQP